MNFIPNKRGRMFLLGVVFGSIFGYFFITIIFGHASFLLSPVLIALVYASMQVVAKERYFGVDKK